MFRLLIIALLSFIVGASLIALDKKDKLIAELKDKVHYYQTKLMVKEVIDG